MHVPLINIAGILPAVLIIRRIVPLPIALPSVWVSIRSVLYLPICVKSTILVTATGIALSITADTTLAIKKHMKNIYVFDVVIKTREANDKTENIRIISPSIFFLQSIE